MPTLRLALPFILSLFYISFSQAQTAPPSCAQSCVPTAATAAGCGTTDLTCICNSNAFLQAAATCVGMNCKSSADVQAAGEYLVALCSSSSSSGAPASPSAPGSSASGSVSAPSPPPSPSPLVTSTGLGSPSMSSPTFTVTSGFAPPVKPTSVKSTSTDSDTSTFPTTSSGNAAAAALPTHAAAFVAGGIGALFAVVV